MSRNFVVLNKSLPTRPPESPAAPSGEHSQSGEYADLITRLFHPHAAVALIGRFAEIAQGIAAELAASGKRVVLRADLNVPVRGSPTLAAKSKTPTSRRPFIGADTSAPLRKKLHFDRREVRR